MMAESMEHFRQEYRAQDRPPCGNCGWQEVIQIRGLRFCIRCHRLVEPSPSVVKVVTPRYRYPHTNQFFRVSAPFYADRPERRRRFVGSP